MPERAQIAPPPTPTLTVGEARDVLRTWATGQTMNERQLLAAFWMLREDIIASITPAARPAEWRTSEVTDALNHIQAKVEQSDAWRKDGPEKEPPFAIVVSLKHARVLAAVSLCAAPPTEETTNG